MALKMWGLFIIFLCKILEMAQGQSLTIVLDTTMSMQDDIDVIKSNLRSVVDAVRFEPYITEFVLVTFSDPNVGTPVTTKSPEEFLRAVNAIKTSGGTDCPENSLAGIRKALETSKPESYIYVFTDAFAKDYNQVSAVKDLCKTTRSKVVIFLSGSCSTTEGTIDIYKEITQYCSGAVFQLGPSNFRKAFQIMEEITAVEWSNVKSFSSISDGFEFEVSLTSFSSNMLVVATGEKSLLLVRDCDDCEDFMRDTKSFHVIRVKPHVGSYRATLRCETCLSLVIYERLSLQFEYGFSSRPVKNIKETTLKPIPDAQNYITVFLTNTEGVSISSMELKSGGKVTQLQVDEVSERPGCYSATEYIDAKQRYRLVIHGYDSSSSQQLAGSTRILEPQKTGFVPASMAPIIEIVEPENSLVEFGASVTVPCRITAYPQPEIWWEDSNQNKLTAEEVLLETPAVYMSYVSIDNLATNSTIFCKAKNWDGEASQELNLYINRTAFLEFVEEPKDDTIMYGTMGQLTCEVESYPAATIKWYHNDTLLESTEKNVVISQMGLEDVGEYKCEASNTVETKTSTATISISGLAFVKGGYPFTTSTDRHGVALFYSAGTPIDIYPEVATDKSVMSVSPGEWACIKCRIVSGNPSPDVSWQYKADDNSFFGDVPSGAYTTEGPSLCSKTAGLYKCTGSNILGENTKEVVVKIKSPPKIRNDGDETVTVKSSRRVELPCDVESMVSTSVRWEISQGDELIALSERHRVDSKNTLRFNAQGRDSGSYHCIAENEFGRADKTYNVIVLVEPYIDAPSAKTVTARAGSTITLPCVVVSGNPTPTTRWEFHTYDSPPKILLRGDSTNNLTLHIENITKDQEGKYICIAKNIVRVDSIEITVNVH